MDDIDIHEHAEKAIHHQEHGARGIAILISILAASLAIADMAEKTLQQESSILHVTVTDTWAFYQAKNLRSTTYTIAATLLGDLPNATDPKVQEDIKQAKVNAARMRDEPGGEGMAQLSARARSEEHERDHKLHAYHLFERVVGALQISIVLASVSVVTRVPALAIAAALIGGGASAFGAWVWFAT